jgi:hypothetical protein
LKDAGAKRREWLASDQAFRLMRLTPADIPVELKYEFQLFQRDMKPMARACELDNPLLSAIQTIDDATVGRIIERIVHMHQVMELQPD